MLRSSTTPLLVFCHSLLCLVSWEFLKRGGRIMGSAEKPVANTSRTTRPPEGLDATVVPAKTVVAEDPALDKTGAMPGTMDATVVPPSPSKTSAGAKPASAASAAPAGEGIGPQGRSQLGDFKLIKKLGQGGMGEVFLAHQETLDRKAALKVLAKHLADKEDFVKRFYREARAMAKVDHPNAVRVFAVAEDAGVHFVAMELIDGKSLQDWMDQLGKLSIGDALHITLRCCEALQQAHNINMVHRDIKPDNIMLTSKGVVKVADFGLAKALDDEDMSMTQSGTGLGTPYYMAPEQARNAKHVDGRSDIYALGVTLYYFLTGNLPFSGNSALEVVMAKEKGQFKKARQLNSEISERLDLIVDKMMAKELDHRFKDCQEVIRAIGSLGLDNPALSFITAPDRVSVATAVPAARQASVAPRSSAPGTSGTVKAPAASPAGPRSSADDAARQKPVQLPQGSWFVHYKNAQGKESMSTWTTAQVIQALRAGSIDTRAKVKRKPNDAFVPIAQFPEFEAACQAALAKQKADKKAGDMKSIYAQIDRQQQWRGTVRKIQAVFSGIKGLISLAIYLAVLAGLVVGGWWAWKQYGGQATSAIQTQLNGASIPTAGGGGSSATGDPAKSP
jgi:eukaryotic-like serine/threonine-protein kinase